MTTFDLVIVNAIAVTACDVFPCSISVKDGKIAAIASQGFSQEELAGVEVIDAEGAYVMPGGIDAHVHLCQDLQTGPHGLGGRCADDFASGSMSAAAGGTTTMITFACQTRSEEDASLLSVVERYDARAKATGSYIDYAYHVIIVRCDGDVLERELPILSGPRWGISTCKLFMTYDSQRLGDSDLLTVMHAAAQHGITPLVHAENGDMISWLTDKLEAKGMLAPIYHAWSRPPIVQDEATNRAIAIAKLACTPFLFVHVGSSEAMAHIRRAQTQGWPVYAETCPQYICLTYNDLKRFYSPTCFENSKMVCSPPPPPDESESERLYTGLANGTFTVFSSDHCPFRYDDPHGKPTGILEHEESKRDGDCVSKETSAVSLDQLVRTKTGAFRFIPNGIPGVETRLSLLFTNGVCAGKITLQRFVELTSTNVAKLYGLYPKKGSLMPGADADFAIWHPQETFSPFTLSNDMLHHNVDYTPYEGMRMLNWPRYTIVRGHVVWANGSLATGAPLGRYQKRGPNALSSGWKKRGGGPAKQHPAPWLFE